MTRTEVDGQGGGGRDEISDYKDLRSGKGHLWVTDPPHANYTPFQNAPICRALLFIAINYVPVVQF